jgi:hypothetical protein
MPVRAIGGAASFGSTVGDAMKPLATTYRASSSPTLATGSPRRRDETLNALTSFLAPYGRSAGARTPGTLLLRSAG